MKAPLSVLLATLLVVVALTSAPGTTRAQAPTDGATPTPGAAAPPEQAAPPGQAAPPEQAAPADASAMPTDDEDTAPDDPAADDVTVQRGREDRDEGQAGQHVPGGGGNNVVMVRNHSDGDLRIRGRIRLAELHGSRAEPMNLAFAYASCTDCQTYAVALEIALVAPGASTIAPQNRAHALNYECTRCVTVARALQYVFVVDDPSIVPDNVDRLMRDMEKEIRDIGHTRGISATEANARVDAVIDRFQDLASGLQDQVDETDQPTTPGAPAPTIPASPAAPVPSPSPSGD
jgi:putative peptide zinc metalloprotease protein